MGALIAFLILATAGMVGRLAWIQIVSHGQYSLDAQAEHLDKERVRSSRGAILDRNGFPLATSTDAFDIYVDRRAWRSDSPDRPQRVASAIAPLLGKNTDSLLAFLKNDADGPIGLVEDQVDFDVGQQIQKMALPGISVVAATKRYYPEGDIASGILGFLGRDHKGLAGLEADLDDTLSGTPGAIYFERDSTGQPIAFGAEPHRAGQARLRRHADHRPLHPAPGREPSSTTGAQGPPGQRRLDHRHGPEDGCHPGHGQPAQLQALQLSLGNPRPRPLPQSRRHGPLRARLGDEDDHHGSRPSTSGSLLPNTTYLDTGTVVKGGYDVPELGLQRQRHSDHVAGAAEEPQHRRHLR